MAKILHTYLLFLVFFSSQLLSIEEFWMKIHGSWDVTTHAIRAGTEKSELMIMLEAAWPEWQTLKNPVPKGRF